MPYFKTVTVRVAPRFLSAGLVFFVILLIVSLPAVSVLLNLRESYQFLNSDAVLAIAVIIVVLLLSFIVLPLLLLWFSDGWITVDSFKIKWKIKNESGEVSWKYPFTVKRWQSVISIVTGETAVGQYGNMNIPAIVYEISQENVKVAFWREATFDEIKGLPSAELHGIMLHHHAKQVTNIIDQLKYEKH